MASQTKSAGLGQSIIYGTRLWANPTNIYTSNNLYANSFLESDELSHWLRATNFGFTIPDGATIDGIKVEYEKKASAFGIEDSAVKIVKAGSEAGDNKARAEYWSTTEGYVPYGGATDKWGLTWTPAQINAEDFGVSMAVYYGEDESARAYVDHIRVTVYYTEAVGTNMKIKASAAWRDADEIKIKASGAWKSGAKAWQKVGGAWKVIFG